MTYSLPITPVACPRPRVTRSGIVYYPKNYTQYKKDIAWLIKGGHVAKGKYSDMEVNFYLPYPKGTPKKNLIEGKRHDKKPDWDNLVKGFMDALTDAGIWVDDSKVSGAVIKKMYTTQPIGRIEFSLQ